MRKLTQIENEFEDFLKGTFLNNAVDMPADQRHQLEMAFYGGVRMAVTAIIADPMKLIEYDIELDVWIKEYEACHGL